MKTNKFRAWLFVLGIACVVFFSISAANAAPQTVEADGYYTVGDGLEENHSTAKLRAKEAAKGRAAEQAAVLVEKSVSVKNHQLTASEIRTVAAKVMKIIGETITPEVEGNTIRYHCHIVAVVDDGNVMDSLLADRQRLEESEMEMEALRKRNEALAKEMEDLKQKMKSANADEQRSLLESSKTNDKRFQATQWCEMGWQMRDAGDNDGALASFRKASSLDPQFIEAYLGMAAVYCNMGELAKSVESGEQAMTLAPDEPRAYMLTGFASFQVGDHAKGIDYLEKAIKLGARFAPVYGTLGSFYVQIGKSSEAIPYLEKAISMDPGVGAYPFFLSQSYCELGKYQKALECVNKAIELGNGEFEYELYLGRGVIYETMGRKKEAKRDYAKAYELNPKDERCQRVKKYSANW